MHFQPKNQLQHQNHLQGVEEEQEHQVEPVPLELLPEGAEALRLGLDPTLHLPHHLSCIQLVFCWATTTPLSLLLLLILTILTDATWLGRRHEERLIAGACCLVPYNMPSSTAHHRIGANSITVCTILLFGPVQKGSPRPKSTVVLLSSLLDLDEQTCSESLRLPGWCRDWQCNKNHFSQDGATVVQWLVSVIWAHNTDLACHPIQWTHYNTCSPIFSWNQPQD